MRQSPLLEFESTAFPVTPGEDEETNPGIFGKSLANWLRDALCARGLAAGDVFAEDFGWCVPIRAEGFRLYVACSSDRPFPAGPESVANASQWLVFAFAEGGWLRRLFGRDRTEAELAAVFSCLRSALESNPAVSNLVERGD